jgi:hypothetical protein
VRLPGARPARNVRSDKQAFFVAQPRKSPDEGVADSNPQWLGDGPGYGARGWAWRLPFVDRNTQAGFCLFRSDRLTALAFRRVEILAARVER